MKKCLYSSSKYFALIACIIALIFSDQLEAFEQLEVVEQTEAAEQIEAVEQTEAAEQIEAVEQTEVAEQIEAVEQTEAAEDNFGTRQLPDGSIYEGGIVNGKFNGKGTQTWSNGMRFEGFFEDGLYTGEGTMFFPSGAKTICTYMFGLKHGENKLYNDQGKLVMIAKMYAGIGSDFKKRFTIDGDSSVRKIQKPPLDINKLDHSQAELPSGQYYVGDRQAGLFHGNGKLISSNGTVHEGNFKAGLFEGEIIASVPSIGFVVKTDYKNGLFTGTTRSIRGDQTIVESAIVDGGIRHGKTSYLLRTGEKRVLTFENGFDVTFKNK